MKLPVVRGYTLMWGMSLTKEADKYRVELWRQPLHRWLAHELYHAYDSVIFTVPGYTWVQRWDQRVRMWWHRGDDGYVLPWGARQDIRCYDLGEKGRVTVKVIDVDRATYEEIKTLGGE